MPQREPHNGNHTLYHRGKDLELVFLCLGQLVQAVPSAPLPAARMGGHNEKEATVLPRLLHELKAPGDALLPVTATLELHGGGGSSKVGNRYECTWDDLHTLLFSSSSRVQQHLYPDYTNLSVCPSDPIPSRLFSHGSRIAV